MKILKNNPLKARLRRWFDRRSPRQDQFSLGLSTIYVFFSPQGYLYLALLVITFTLGTNYGNNLVLSVFFYLVAVWLISAVATFLQLYQLTFEIKSVSLAQARSIAWVEFVVSTPAKPSRQIELGFDVDERLLAVLEPSEQALFEQNRQRVLANTGTHTTVRLPILTDKRGVMSLPRLSIRTTYPLGITQAWGYGFFARQALVYPAPKPFDGNALAQMTQLDDGAGGQLVAGTDDFDKLDSYVAGESLSRVSWSHVARGMGMLTKHFGDGVRPNETLDYYAVPALNHEDKLSNLAYVLLQKDPQNPFYLNLPSGQSPLGAGQAFIDECLIRLAKEP